MDLNWGVMLVIWIQPIRPNFGTTQTWYGGGGGGVPCLCLGCCFEVQFGEFRSLQIVNNKKDNNSEKEKERER